MTLAELENTLPNGFHDGVLLGMDVRLDEARVVLRMLIDVSTRDEDNPYVSKMREVEVALDELQTIIVEAPDKRYPLEPGAAHKINGFTPTEKQFPGLLEFPEDVRKNAHGLYLGGNWNSFVLLAAKSVRIVWKEVDRSLSG